MASTGTYSFSPSLTSLTLYAYNLAGVRSTALAQEHLEFARMAANMVCAEWSNRGVNLWEVDLQTISLVQGTSTYSIPASTVVMLDAYVEITNSGGQTVDRYITPISRSEYATYAQKQQQGFPTVYWMDRLLSPTVTLWPVPDGNEATFKYYRLVQIQDAATANAATMNLPYLFLDAFSYALAYRLALAWTPERAQALKAQADSSYMIAAEQNEETAQQFISPDTSSYFRV